jgi:hypothetical protein
LPAGESCNGVEFTVIGVASAEFTGIDPYLRPDLFLPAMMPARLAAGVGGMRSKTGRTAKGRLKPGVIRAQASANLDAMARSLARTYPETNRNWGVLVRTEMLARVGRSPVDGGPGDAAGIAGVVLRIACANVAILLLSPARSRTREVAIRLAVGAGRVRLVRQLLIESLLLSLAGGLGLLAAAAGIRYLGRSGFPPNCGSSSRWNWTGVRWFSLLVWLASGAAFGLAPVLPRTRADPASGMKGGARPAPGSMSWMSRGRRSISPPRTRCRWCIFGWPSIRGRA